MHENHSLQAEAPLVSILILNLNGLEDTRNCLASLENDGYENKEILLLDNGSDIHEFKELQQQYAESVHLLRSEHNMGFAAGNNYLAQYASGTYLVLLNNDTEVTTGWLEPLVAHLEGHEEVAVCQPKIRSLIHRDQFDYAGACGGFIDRFGYPFTRGRVLETVEKDAGQYDDPLAIHWASGACCIVRKNIWEEEGGLDERFFAYMEEVDFCWRLRRSGHSIMSIPQAVIYHKGGQVWRKSPFTKRFHEHRNNLLMLVSNYSGLHLITRMPIRLLLECASILYYLAHGKVRLAAAALWSLCHFVVLAPVRFFQRERRVCNPPLCSKSIVVGYFLWGSKKYASLVMR